ncbi:MAG TPA: hypothetical protein VKZ79_19690 [Alphaproteobacteria bacterium]|nr:hypothetical protein [Alphaproteobacteria bacterium]
MPGFESLPETLRERIFTRSPLSLERQLEDMLAMADRHIREGRERVARQRAMVLYRRAKGWRSRLSEDLLQGFEDALANHCHRRDQLRAYLTGARRTDR